MPPYMKTLVGAKGNQETYLDVTYSWGTVNMLYVSTHSPQETEALIELCDLFGKHKLHLECALPTALLLIKERYGTQIVEEPICRLLPNDDLRSNTKKLIESCLSKETEFQVIHPVKMSKLSNSDWSQHFETFIRS